MNTDLSIANQDDLTTKEWRVLDMTVAGATLRQIAAEVGYASASGALGCQRRALKKYAAAVGDDIDEWRGRVISGLLYDAEKLAPAVSRGDVQAIKAHVEIMKTFTNIHGLKAPERVEALLGIVDLRPLTAGEQQERIAKAITMRPLLEDDDDDNTDRHNAAGAHNGRPVETAPEE